MRAKVKYYSTTIFHGMIEGISFFPVLLLLGIISSQTKETLLMWFLGLLFIFLIGFLTRDILLNQKRLYSFIVGIVIVALFSFLLFDSVLAISGTFLTSIGVVYRGIQHAEKTWQLLMPSHIFWMVCTPIYFIGYFIFSYNEALSAYKEWIGIAGFLFIIIMVFITGRQKLQYAAHSKDHQKSVERHIQRFNNVFLLVTLGIVFLLSNFQMIQATIGLAIRSLVNKVLHSNKEPSTDTNVGMDQPDAPSLEFEIGDQQAASSLPTWLDNILWAIGILILIGFAVILAMVIFKNFRKMIKNFLLAILNLFRNKFRFNQQQESSSDYEDEKESLFNFAEIGKGLKENVQDIYNKVTNRKPKFDKMSTEEKIRYMYRLLAGEVKKQEQWRASLTAHETLLLNERRENLKVFKRWYDDIRYGKLELDEHEEKRIEDFWTQLQ